MFHYLLTKDIGKFKSANIVHNISHDLLDILDGKSAKEVFTDDENEEDEGTAIGSIAVNIKTGDVHGIENIKDPKLKEQLATVIGKLADKLGGN